MTGFRSKRNDLFRSPTEKLGRGGGGRHCDLGAGFGLFGGTFDDEGSRAFRRGALRSAWTRRGIRRGITSSSCRRLVRVDRSLRLGKNGHHHVAVAKHVYSFSIDDSLVT